MTTTYTPNTISVIEKHRVTIQVQKPKSKMTDKSEMIHEDFVLISEDALYELIDIEKNHQKNSVDSRG